MDKEEFRGIKDSERCVLSRLLEVPFPGSDGVAKQLQNAMARSIDSSGSLDFLVNSVARAEVHNSVPVEAEGEDIDGVTVHILLHVIEGLTRGLEVYKEDLSNVIRMPEPSKLRLFSPP